VFVTEKRRAIGWEENYRKLRGEAEDAGLRFMMVAKKF